MTDDLPPRRPILTAEDLVKRIAAECAFAGANGEVGIRLRPAAAIVRQYGEQFSPCAAPAAASAEKPGLL
jgi:hypothetical protein